MKLLLIRHGIAADKEEFKRRGIPDEARPLTQQGRDQLYEVARGLAAIVDRIDVLGVSPLLRAKETADIIDERFSAEKREMTHSLRPDQPHETFLGWLRLQKGGVIAAVGHEPHLSGLMSYFLHQPCDELDKGGAALIDFPDKVADGAGKLVWVKTAAELSAT